MDASVFYNLVKNHTSLTEAEYQELNKLHKDHPYSQIITLILARASQDLNHPDKEKSLHQAAVYATERSILKHVMTAPRKSRVLVPEVPVEEPSLVEIEEDFQEEEREQLMNEAPDYEEVAAVTASNSLSGDALREDIYFQLEKLQKLKKEFNRVADSMPTDLQEVIESKPKVKQVKQDEADPLIEEIKTTKKKLKIDNPKQKEQNEIIDQFIKVKPSIPKAKPSETASDLSEDSAVLSDNAVSETLVELLIKQGKKDKAIEVLKKLIWKFPQKKAYFAAQIDSLKN